MRSAAGKFIAALTLVLAGGLLWGGPRCLAVEAEDGRIKAILARWVEALGGAQAIHDLRSVDYRCKIDYGLGSPPVELHIRSDADGHYRYDYELPNSGHLTQAYDGRSGWQHSNELGSGPLSQQEHGQNVLGISFHSPILVGSTYPDKKLQLDEMIAGRRLQVLLMTDRTGTKSKWYFDPDTGLRVRVELPDALGGALTIDYSDFRRAGSVREPFRTVRSQGGRQLNMLTEAMVCNEGMDPILLSPPLDFIEETREVNRILLFNRQVSGLADEHAITTRVTVENTDITTAGIKFPTTISQKLPNLIVVETTMPGVGKSLQGFDGRIGWAWSELQGYRTMQGAELQQLLASANFQGALKLYEMCPLRRLLDERGDDEHRSVGIALASMAGPAGKLYFDVKSGQLVRMESIVQTGPSGSLNVVAEFSDFRSIDGVVFAFRTVITNPAVQMIVTVQSIKHNVPLDDSIFLPKKEE